MTNMTAVEWLISQYIKDGFFKKGVYEQAMEIEKQQIKDAYGKISMFSEQYYNETYGSDEIKKAEEMGLYDKIELSNPNDSIFTSSQTEISEPDPQLIESMSYRYRHDFGLLQDDEKNVIRTIMKQLWEEVVGKGFYKQTEISDESWEGCDGCTEQDEVMYKNGYVKGYNIAISELHKETSDEEIKEAAKDYHRNNGVYYGQEKTFIDAIKWYREQLKKK